MSLASDHDLVIFDLDGVVYLGTEAVPGAPEAIKSIVDSGVPVAFATNNASRSAAEVAALLVGLGVPARAEEVVTSGQAAAELLAADLPPGAPVLAVGAPALRAELVAVGLTPVDTAVQRPVAVVQGYGPAVSWPELAEACLAVRAGARWVATNTDATMPSPRGPLPGNGSLVAVLTTALGGQAPDTVVGKPEPVLFQVAAAHRHAGRILVVGDRLDTDVEGANRAGLESLLVLTGVSTPADLLAASPARRPTHVAAGCAALSTPDSASRIPAGDHDSVVSGGWRVSHDEGRLTLARDPDAPLEPGADLPGGWGDDDVAALRALARSAWIHPEWTAIQDADPAAERALAALRLAPVWRAP